MVVRRDNMSQIIAWTSVGFGALALLLACVGIGTPNWQTSYQYTSGQAQVYYTNNFFYACSYFTNGSQNQCVNRNASLTYYQNTPFSGYYSSGNDTNARLQNAAGLSVVGLLFIAFGTVATLIIAIISLPTWFNLIPPILLFLACLFMLSGMAEGSRVLYYNDYSANLYQAAHLFTILSFGLSALAAGRLHFERMYGNNT